MMCDYGLNLLTPLRMKMTSVILPCCSALKYLIVFLGCLLMSGCFSSNSLDDALSEYAKRLSRVLDTPLPLPENAYRLNYPKRSKLTSSSATININLKQFYAIQHCNLGSIVAERNTTLGKVQLPSQRFVYEHHLLNALAQCQPTLENQHTPLAHSIAQWQMLKQNQYQNAWANVIQNSQAMKLGLSVPTALLKASNNQDANSTINALYYLNSLTSPSTNLQSSTLETQLQLIESSRLPAKIWLTQHVLSAHLHALTTALRPALQQVNCTNGKASEKATILRNVFYLFFIKKIQPTGSTLNQYHYKLMPLWQQWIDNSALSDPFKRYIRSHAVNNFSHYQQNMTEHVTLWQHFLARCNLSPQPAS